MSEDAQAFAERFDAVRDGEQGELTEVDVRRAVEQAIRKGSVTAMRLWLDRYGGDRKPQAPAGDEYDELKAWRAARGA